MKLKKWCSIEPIYFAEKFPFQVICTLFPLPPKSTDPPPPKVRQEDHDGLISLT